MNLFELFVKIGVDDQASKKLADISSKLGNGLKTAAKIGTAAVGTAAAGITALTKAAVDNYAEYEQLVGGVDTLFKDASQKVQQYASEAYRTSGMSANDYMANATAFSASLISALGDDTEAAAEYANRAMVSMSDNANKMGTNIDSIVQTYQSLARGNFAMLDNLKLGYGGTKAELERLIADAASYTEIQKEMGITVDASSTSFDNIVNAIAVVQGKLGIAGATALEAGTTIEGSVNSMKAAWDNLITGVADKNADLEGLINDLVTTIVGDGTENNLGVIGNILPAIETALGGIATLIEKAAPVVVGALPKILSQVAPSLISAGIKMVEQLVDGISKNQKEVTKAAFDIIKMLTTSFIKLLPKIIKLGLEVIVSLAEGIADSLDEIIPTVVDVVIQIVETLTDPDTLTKLLDAALEIIMTLAEYLLEDDVINKLVDAAVEVVKSLSKFLVDNIDKLLNAALEIMGALFDYLTDEENQEELLKAGAEIIMALSEAIIAAVDGLSEVGSEVALRLFEEFSGIDLSEAGEKVFKSFVKGLTSGFSGAGVLGPIEFGKSIGESVGGELFTPDTEIHDSTIPNYDYGSIYGTMKTISPSNMAPLGGTSIGNVNINVDGAKYGSEESLAEKIAFELQNMTDRRYAVYA